MPRFYLNTLLTVAVLALGGCSQAEPEPSASMTEAELREALKPLPMDLPERFVNSQGIEMQLVQPGVFTLGDDYEFQGEKLFDPEHLVGVDGFYLARFEMMVEQFEEFARETNRYDKMPEYNPSRQHTDLFAWGEGPKESVMVDWYTADEFCKWLSEKEGRTYRLPTNAEFEYALRADTDTLFWWGDEIAAFVGNCNHGNDYYPTLFGPTGSYAMNPWGFFDLAGLRMEWTSDWHDPDYYRKSPQLNPKGPKTGTKKVARNGSGLTYLNGCMAAYFLGQEREKVWCSFRVVCEITEELVIGEHEIPNPVIPPAPEPPDLSGIHYEVWELAPGVDLKMAYIPPGKFMMGSPEDEAPGYRIGYKEGPQFEAFITGFYMSETELTQAQYKAIIGENPSNYIGEDLPVGMVNSANMWSFVQAINKRYSGKLIGGAKFDKPRESQWEYACRAGTQTAYYFGDDPELLPHFGWFERTDGPQPVAQKLPNAFGLYDMHGNVMEWCYGATDENYSAYQKRFFKDPLSRTDPRTGGGGGLLYVVVPGTLWLTGHVLQRDMPVLIFIDMTTSAFGSSAGWVRVKNHPAVT
jgi:formylglycine-generating enzyme required for sulfatase activity